MAKIHVCEVLVLDNPADFTSKLEFEITFECLKELKEDLEWKIIYVGSAESEEYDQVLDTVYVGPVPEGRHKFVFTADPPNPEEIPVSDVVGVTVILITCLYRSQEFIRVGYYVNNSYAEDPELQEDPPSHPIFHKLKRNILATNPRVTKFKVKWDNEYHPLSIPSHVFGENPEFSPASVLIPNDRIGDSFYKNGFLEDDCDSFNLTS